MSTDINFEEMAISFIPIGIREVIRQVIALYKGNVSEIRMRVNSPVYITVNNNNISCSITATKTELDQTVRNLCGNSMYSHSETIKEGYICSKGGIRTGICGRAIMEGDRIISVCDITSICIRIPHRVEGLANILGNKILSSGGGMLIYSKPGVGKTTILREITSYLSGCPLNYRVSVVDTRYEICGALYGNYSVDVLGGYPRDKGMETAIRTLSPQYIICDEIANSSDVKAILNSVGAGVPVIASTHAGDCNELKNNHNISMLLDTGVFKNVVGLKRIDGIMHFIDSDL